MSEYIDQPGQFKDEARNYRHEAEALLTKNLSLDRPMLLELKDKFIKFNTEFEYRTHMPPQAREKCIDIRTNREDAIVLIIASLRSGWEYS